MEDAGLEVEVDERGNLVGRLQGAAPNCEVWDRVPPGLGARGWAVRRSAGVVAGLEAVTAIGRTERTLGVGVPG